MTANVSSNDWGPRRTRAKRKDRRHCATRSGRELGGRPTQGVAALCWFDPVDQPRIDRVSLRQALVRNLLISTYRQYKRKTYLLLLGFFYLTFNRTRIIEYAVTNGLKFKGPTTNVGVRRVGDVLRSREDDGQNI